MKKALVIAIFVIGLGIFSYPIISNLLATKVHYSVINDYNETVEKMNEEAIKEEKEKANKHNEELKDSEMVFVDPYAGTNDASNEHSGNKSYYDAMNIQDSTIGSIEIPKIDVELPVYHGTNEKVLSQGAGHLENSSLPTGEKGTHSVITAHRGLPSAKMFRDL
ncbi:class C sortase, partial [Pontibacillus litoralis]